MIAQGKWLWLVPAVFALATFPVLASNWRGEVTCPLPKGTTCQVSIFTFFEDGQRYEGESHFALPGGETHRFQGTDGQFATWCYSEDGSIPQRATCAQEGVMRRED